MGGISGLIVVKINVDGLESSGPAFHLADPFRKPRLAVTSLVFAVRWSMQPDIGEISCDFQGRMVACQFVNTKGGIELFENAVDFRRHPTGFTEFEGVAMLAWKNCQQVFQALSIDLPPWRQLKQHWAELFAKVFGAREDIINRVFRLFQLFVVSNETAGLYGKDEIAGRRVAPAFKRANRRQAIKTVV